MSKWKSKSKKVKKKPKTLMPYVIYYVLVYEYSYVVVMLTYDHSCFYCIIVACQECMIKINPL